MVRRAPAAPRDASRKHSARSGSQSNAKASGRTGSARTTFSVLSGSIGVILFIDQVDKLLAFFEPHCQDVETLTELRGLLRSEKDWGKAHYLSTRIRTRAQAAAKAGDLAGEIQLSFEETCAKALHNMSASKKPFDPDTPYWILPLALNLARMLELDTQRVVEIAMS